MPETSGPSRVDRLERLAELHSQELDKLLDHARLVNESLSNHDEQSDNMSGHLLK